MTLELPHVELPTVEVPRIEASACAPDRAHHRADPEPEPFRPPVLERPIVILSAPRAGSTLLFETLAQAAGVYTIGGESHQLIESIAALRPGRGVARSNRLTRSDATTAIVTELRQRFAGRIHDRDGQAPGSGARVRLLEKTPKNALRVPFLLEVFPDAQFIFLHREPRANLSSMMQAWRAKGWVTYRQLPGWPGPWSLLLPPGYERLQGRPLEEIVAFQWRVANETILDDLADLPRERWTSLRYEDLVGDPRAEIAKLLDFTGLAMDARLEDYLSKPLPLSKHTQTKPDPDKWKQNAAEIERVMPSLAAISRATGRLGRRGRHPEAPVFLQGCLQPVMRQFVGGKAVRAGHRLRGHEGIHDRFFGRLDRREEQRAQHVVGKHLQLRHAAPRCGPGICRGKRDEDVARAIGGIAAHAAEPQRRALCDAPELVRQQRRVGRDHHDDRAALVRLRRPAGGEVRDLLAHRHAGDAQRLADPVVRLHQRADDVPPASDLTWRDAVPMPPLKPCVIIPVPPPTLPSSTGPALAASSAAKACSRVT